MTPDISERTQSEAYSAGAAAGVGPMYSRLIISDLLFANGISCESSFWCANGVPNEGKAAKFSQTRTNPQMTNPDYY